MHISKTVLLVMVLFAALGVSAVCQAGKIKRTQSATGSSSSSSNDDDDDDDDDHDDDDNGVLGAILCAFFCKSSGDANNEKRESIPKSYVRRDVRYNSYPYDDKRPGLATVREQHYSASHELKREIMTPEEATPSGKGYAGMLNLDYNYDWDNVHIGTLRLRVLSNFSIGVDVRFSSYFEPVENDKVDTMYMPEFAIHANLIRTSNWIGRLGVSGQLLVMESDEVTAAGGGGFFVGFDYMPARPFVFSFEGHLGYLHNSFYLRGEGTVGVMVAGPWEVNVGYRGQLFVNKDTAEQVPYHGFTGGLRLWF